MKDLVDYTVKQIVTKPEEVSIDEHTASDGTTEILIKVAPEDMGLIIGKSGQTIKSIRKLVIVRAMAENQRVRVSLIEPNVAAPQSKPDSSLAEE